MPTLSPRFKANILLLLTAAVWGIGFVAQRSAIEDGMGSISFTGIRFFLGWLCIQPFIFKLSREKRKNYSSKYLQLLLCLFMLVGAVLQQIGMETTSASKAGFLTSIYVVLTPILAAIWSHKIKLKTWAGAFFVIVGLYYLSMKNFEIKTGDLLVILGACMWAGQVLVLDVLTKIVNPIMLASRQFLFVACICLIWGGTFENQNADIWLNAIPEILFSGFFSIGIAFTFQAIAQVHAPPSDAAILMSCEAVFAAIFGFLILGELLNTRELIGCLLVFAGVLVSQIRWKNLLH